MKRSPTHGISLQTRLAIIVTSLCVILTLLVGAGIWQAVRRASIDALDRELAASADVLTQLVHLDKDGSIDVEDHGDGKLAIAHRIESADGQVLGEGGLRWRTIVLQGMGTEAVVVDGQPWRVLSRTLDLERKGRDAQVILRVATSARPMIELRETAGRAVLFATAAAALLGALASVLVARATTAPLRTLTRRVGSLGASALDETLEATGGDREVLALTSSFNGLLRRLQAAFERQRAFVARASHALRTPTATILTRAEVTLARPRGEEEYRAALGEIADAARESAALVDHLLSLARFDQAELRAERVDLGKLAGELERLLAPRAAGAGVALSFSVPPGATAVADRAALRELLEALLDNALRYTPRGGAAGLRADAGTLVVWDTGKGMSEKDKARAFERFFRGSAAEATGAPGSGLGLAIAQVIAEKHGAALVVRDRDGGGLEVVCRWPDPGAAAATG